VVVFPACPALDADMGECSVPAAPLPCRVIFDPPAAGTWNMAVDEALLRSVASGGQPALRFYTWSVPTLSLGYFQSLQERSRHAASSSCSVVRRASGGGAIVHDVELTYSLALPASHSVCGAPAQWPGVVHRSLADALAQFGPAPTLCQQRTGQGPEPWLCFQRRAPGDLVLGPHKIAGSAQRRLRAAILQHGSVILRRSAAAPELPGWCDLAGLDCSPRELAERWRSGLCGALGMHGEVGELSAAEIESASQCRDARYASPAWTGRR
jgi:lipoate-protein ligase A